MMKDLVDLKKWVDSDEFTFLQTPETIKQEISKSLEKILEKYIELEHFTLSPHCEYFTLSDGKSLVIGKDTSNVIFQLRSLKMVDLLKVMKVSDSEISDFYKIYRDSLKAQILEIFKKEWFWCETGEPLIFNEYDVQFMSGYQISKRKLISRVKNDKFSIQELSGIIDFFTHERTEVYCNEPNN